MMKHECLACNQVSGLLDSVLPSSNDDEEESFNFQGSSEGLEIM